MFATVALETEECCACHMTFAMSKDFKQQKMDARGTDKASFYCPAGHQQHYRGQTELDATKRLLQNERERAERNWQEAQAARRSAIAQKAQATRIRNRIQHGVCPDCKRSFSNLREHMKAKHTAAA